jgi:hypothetical protein
VHKPGWRDWLRPAPWVALPVAALTIPYYIRNALIYGLSDLLVWKRHAEVASGQLSTADYMRWHDWGEWIWNLVRTTFQSFWGQFGWMAVPMNQRVYLPLWAISIMAGMGLLYVVSRAGRARLTGNWAGAQLSQDETQLLIPLLLTALLTVGLYLWYNRQYVQFQGRYLFPAMAAWGLGFAVGLNEILRRSHDRRMATLFGLGLWALVGANMDAGGLDKLSLAWMAAAFGGFLAKRWLPERHNIWLIRGVYALLLLLSAAAPFVYVQPFLQPVGS